MIKCILLFLFRPMWLPCPHMHVTAGWYVTTTTPHSAGLEAASWLVCQRVMRLLSKQLREQMRWDRIWTLHTSRHPHACEDKGACQSGRPGNILLSLVKRQTESSYQCIASACEEHGSSLFYSSSSFLFFSHNSLSLSSYLFDLSIHPLICLCVYAYPQLVENFEPWTLIHLGLWIFSPLEDTFLSPYLLADPNGNPFAP